MQFELVVDADRNLVEISPDLMLILGYDLEELIGKDVYPLVLQEGFWETAAARFDFFKRVGPEINLILQNSRMRVPIRTKSGKPLWVCCETRVLGNGRFEGLFIQGRIKSLAPLNYILPVLKEIPPNGGADYTLARYLEYPVRRLKNSLLSGFCLSLMDIPFIS